MELSSVNNNVNAYAAANTAAVAEEIENTAEQVTDPSEDKAAVYEKSQETAKDSANRIYDRDSIVAKLKADQQSRIDSMQSLVQKLLSKQADKAANFFDLTTSTNLADTFRQISQDVDQETIDAAKESISEDGYWGVNQTSDRLVSMAIALSGGDTSKADLLMDAIQKGYDKATAAWGEDLPQLCKDTLDATMQKMEDWKAGKTTAADYSTYLQ